MKCATAEPGSDSEVRVEEQVGGVPLLDAVAADWLRLCDEASNDEPFYRPEWIRANLRAFAPDARLLLFTCRAGNRLTGVLPLVWERGFFCGLPVRRLRSASNVHSCRFDLLRARGHDGDAAVAAIWERLKARRGWDVLELRDVPEDGALAEWPHMASRDGFPYGRWESMRTPWVPLSTSCAGRGEPWLAQTSAKFRAEIRRKTQRLSASGEIRCQRIESADERWLQTFYRLESSSWKAAAGTAIDCDRQTRAFYDEVAAAAARFGYLSLYFLECGGVPIAGQYGLSYRGRYFLPKLASDESYNTYGPGHMLIEAILRDCAERGISSYDFIGPWAAYKAKWTRAVRPHHWLWVFRKSLYGRVLHETRFTLRAGVKRAVLRFPRDRRNPDQCPPGDCDHPHALPRREA